METSISKVLTLEDVQRALPTRKGAITQEIVDMIVKSQSDPEFQGESLLQTAVTYEHVLKGSKAGIKDYLYALKFVAYMVSMEDNYTEAYKRTFVDREFVQERMNLPSESTGYRELTSAASRYRKSKLVVDILTLSQVPLDLMFTGAKYKAMAVLADEMVSAKFSKDRIAAADKLLTHAASSTQKIELDIGPSSGMVDMQQQLFAQLAGLAANQQQLLKSGMSITEVQKTNVNLNVIEGDYEES